jgi:hypothetical protein
MAQEDLPNAPTLVFIHNRKSHLSLPRFARDIARPSDQGRATALVEHSNQGHMRDKVYVQKKRDFSFREAAFHSEKAPIQGLSAGALDGVD